MATTEPCFHCALPNPRGCDLTVELEGRDRAVCCLGCKAVAELIRDSGMSNYYELRETPQPGFGKPLETNPEWQIFNTSEMLHAFAEFVDADGDNNEAEATIYAGGIYCSACSWLIETAMTNLAGVTEVTVNPITHRVRIRFQHERTSLGDLLGALANLGYQPQPLAPLDAARPETAEQRLALKRLLVASLGMMQVMMFAVGLYAGDYKGIDTDMRHFLRLVSFFVTTPVVFYSAKPFFVSAWRGILARMPGMDLPVSLAIGSAYCASVYATFTGGTAVWFDSVAMFVFFLTLGRYLEMRARHRSVDRTIALSQLLPNTATVATDDGRSVVPVAQLKRDDVIVIRAGDSIPADGLILAGKTTLDEALLTGEAEPQTRTIGDAVAAGSINIDGLIEVRVTSTGSDTTLGAISRLSERARYTRPTFVHLADRIASYVVVALLFVATTVAVYWYFAAPDRAFVITLSVLVVTCPCALALATPAAFAAAASRFSELQLLLTNGDAIEALSRATHIVFDKTGTLTTGRSRVESVNVFDSSYSKPECMSIAAALERASSHPIAFAFRSVDHLPAVTDAQVHLAEGVSGTIDGQTWRIGSAEFAVDGQIDDMPHSVFLSVAGNRVARFVIRDQLRPDAGETLNTLRRMGLDISLASGDQESVVSTLAHSLEIDNVYSRCTPQDKLTIIESLQAAGERVVMVGDGINDAPVLAGADASIAPGHGALLAQTNADLIMLGDSLRPVVTALTLSRDTLRIVRQNLAWAVLYNATALPLAAMGLVPPWLAAIGMSLSSLVVVMNALRLNRYS